MSGKTNRPAPQNLKAKLACGAAASFIAIENGIMSGQNENASVPNTVRKISPAIRNRFELEMRDVGHFVGRYRAIDNSRALGLQALVDGPAQLAGLLGVEPDAVVLTNGSTSPDRRSKIHRIVDSYKRGTTMRRTVGAKAFTSKEC